MVAFLVGDDGVYAWALTGDGWQWAPLALDGRQLRAEVAALRRSLGAAAGRGAFGERADLPPSRTGFDLDKAHALYRALLGPFESLIGDKPNLLVVPSGPLASLPFQTLVTEPPPRRATGPDAYRQVAWLVRKHAVTVLPSVVSLSALDQFSVTGGADLPFIGFGDPLFDGGAPGGQPAGRGFGAVFAGETVDTNALRQLTPLPESADELRAVAASLGASDEAVIVGDAATEAAVKAAPLDRYRVVHFATHGLIAGELRGVAEPGLVLTPPRRASPADDGLLTAGEVLRLTMNADWVVLSACNTAAGSTEVDEPLSGLARAFFYAGARAMLVSHWPVYSDAAVLLTTGAFAEVASDPAIGRSEALRRAMVAMIDGPDSRGADPVRWAPFSLIGKGW